MVGKFPSCPMHACKQCRSWVLKNFSPCCSGGERDVPWVRMEGENGVGRRGLVVVADKGLHVDWSVGVRHESWILPCIHCRLSVESKGLGGMKRCGGL